MISWNVGFAFRVLTGQGANIDTTTASGRLVFGIFAALAEFERELIRENDRRALFGACPWSQRRPSLHDDTGQAPPGAGSYGQA
jgi:hypothetical protein